VDVLWIRPEVEENEENEEQRLINTQKGVEQVEMLEDTAVPRIESDYTK